MKTCVLDDSPESEAFVNELVEAVKFKKALHNELLKIKKQLKLLKESKKRFQAF